jgi:hypothetical protein
MGGGTVFTNKIPLNQVGGCNTEEACFGYRNKGMMTTTGGVSATHSLHCWPGGRSAGVLFGTARADRHLYPFNRLIPMSMRQHAAIYSNLHHSVSLAAAA